jgi:23S rRNA (adenine2503-C2)-methyltransferase
VKQPPTHLADLTLAERTAKLKELGLPAFRAKQLSTHYFQHWTTDPEAMSDLPKAGREELVSQMFPPLLTEVRRLRTDNGDTIKFLWRLFDGALVESVLMRYPGRITLCVSSQAGCGMNCPFCATGQAGLTRNMSTAEIVDQVVAANRAIAAGELGENEHDAERVTNIVFMGMGEPLANYKRVMGALHRFVDPSPEGLGMSARNITVSTVGLVPAIRKLAGYLRTVAARSRRRAPRRADPGQQPLEGGRGARRRLRLLPQDRPAGQYRVRAHQGYERPPLACRPAG